MNIFHFLINAIFAFSVFIIWLMLIYQFVLCIGGYIWRQRCRKEDYSAISDEMLPGVSILIPARNEAMVIRKTIERMIEFDYPHHKLEVVVVNDGSSDNTGAIIREMAAIDSRVVLFDIPTGESGKGKSTALNKALAVTSHDVIAIFDADNIPERDSLKKLCRALVSNTKLAAVTGKFRAYNKNHNLLTRLVNMESIVFQWIIQAGRWQYLKIASLPGTNFVIWKRVINELGGWDVEALTEDTELTFRIYEKGYMIKFLPIATTWEQEPENLRVWVRQRTRWARGNNYIIHKFAKNIFSSKPRHTLIELLFLFYMYYFFVFAILFSDIFFILSLCKVIHITVMGPYAQLWLLAFFLYVFEVLIALSFEKEDTISNFFVAIIAYLTYTKLWVFVVLKSFVHDYILKQERTWSKTERFKINDQVK